MSETTCVCGLTFQHADDELLRYVIAFDTDDPRPAEMVRVDCGEGQSWVMHAHTGHEAYRPATKREVFPFIPRLDMTKRPTPDA